MRNVSIRAIILSGLFALGTAYTSTSVASAVAISRAQDVIYEQVRKSGAAGPSARLVADAVFFKVVDTFF